MEWVVWLDKHPGAATVISTLLLVIFTAVIAVATVAYVLVTRNLWKATLDTASRTEELARQSRDALKLQVLVTILEGDHPVLEAAGVPPEWTALRRPKANELRALFEAAFPALWNEIEKNLKDAIETVQLEVAAESDPHPR